MLINMEMNKKGAYFQLWTKCRGWSQSKPAENAVGEHGQKSVKAHTELPICS